MVATSEFLLTIGAILLLGLVTTGLAERTLLPRVTLLLLFGILIGPQGLNLIPEFFVLRFDMVADMTLLMVGFLLGGKLTRESFANAAGSILLISLLAALLALLMVALLLVLAGVSLPLAILLGCIASATAPTAILDVVEQTNPNSHFSKLLLAIVAVDDVWALLLFGVGMAVAGHMEGNGEVGFVHEAIVEIFGSVLLGIGLGGPAAMLTGRIKPGEPMLVEAIGVVAVCGGLAMYMDFSYLISAMVMGALIGNLAKHHEYPFHAIEGTEGLFMLVFFVLAGASLDLMSLSQLGLVGGLYVLGRAGGKFVGAWLGCRMAGTAPATRRWMGLALMPQAGVPIGLALVASNEYPQYQQLLLSVVIASTVLFDMVGPILTRLAVRRAHGPHLDDA
ncbi:cation:proton antiporter [Reinekea marinisedimentorum]|uniref:NhaP-type Na+/H+ or K+/H+ antiporter n=1 Tax=Reinekea marinisedimentorum TaxID=230495 RepID=A0A4R3IDY8_9GAMM|nr:cation:proton antiporter [Reinekea marinisedimentorum]TCS43798.1 NhaP-type Na+/H+ or K+/H+ antiporter [Reinekea marinisedimentorum]